MASTASRFGFAYKGVDAVGQHVVAMGLSALLLALAFPRPGWGPLAFVALVPAGIAVARTRRWKTLFWTSVFIWSAWWGWMLGWLWPISPAAPFAVGSYLGLNVALALLACGALHQKLNWPMVVALPLTWVSVEVLRSVWPAGGLNWFTLAQTQAQWSTDHVGRVAQVADLFGHHTVGVVVAVVNGALIDVLLAHRLPRKSLGLGVLVLAGAWGYGQWRITQTPDSTRPGPRIAVVQTSLVQDNQTAPTLEQMVADFQSLVTLHAQAAQSPDPDSPVTLVVWPETMVPAPLNPQGVATLLEHAEDAEGRYSDYGREYFRLRSEFAPTVRDVVRHSGVATIVGAASTFVTPAARYNSAHYYDATGQRADAVYHKQHLVPFGEYVPGPGFLESLIVWLGPWSESYTLTPGESDVPFTIPGGFQVGTPICYEDAVAAVCRRMVYRDGRKQVDVLVNLTNDGWYPGPAMRRQHAQLASLRCIENRVPMVRSVNTGISTFIDSLGRSTAQLSAFEVGTLSQVVQVDSRQTLYAAVGGWPWALWVIFAVGASVFASLFGRPLAKHRIA